MRHNKVFPRNKPGTEEAYILQLVCHVYLPAGGRQKELQLLTDPQQRKHPRPPVEEQTCAQYQRRKCYRELIPRLRIYVLLHQWIRIRLSTWMNPDPQNSFQKT